MNVRGLTVIGIDRNMGIYFYPCTGYTDILTIYPIPSPPQSFLRKVRWIGSYRASTGDEVLNSFILLNKAIKSGVHAMIGISVRKYVLLFDQSDFIPISKYGE